MFPKDRCFFTTPRDCDVLREGKLTDTRMVGLQSWRTAGETGAETEKPRQFGNGQFSEITVFENLADSSRKSRGPLPRSAWVNRYPRQNMIKTAKTRRRGENILRCLHTSEGDQWPAENRLSEKRKLMRNGMTIGRFRDDALGETPMSQ